MKTYKLIIFDADGTLRECIIPGQPCPNRQNEWRLIDGVKDKLSTYDWSKTALGIASNQAGITLGYISADMAYQLLCDMVVAATGYFPPQESIRICPHTPGDNCNCRKPKPGMLIDLMIFFDAEPHETLYVGDMESDREAAKNAGVDYISATVFFAPKLWVSDGPPPLMWST